jgi:hypothetical protein
LLYFSLSNDALAVTQREGSYDAIATDANATLSRCQKSIGTVNTPLLRFSLRSGDEVSDITVPFDIPHLRLGKGGPYAAAQTGRTPRRAAAALPCRIAAKNGQRLMGSSPLFSNALAAQALR